MSILPVPDLMINNVLQLTPGILADMGVSFLILDLDNTLSPYSGKAPSQAVIDWKESLEEHGVSLFIVSNTRTERARRYAELLGVRWTNRAGKPSRKA
jgi:predicted HAD superfamily phosphohydrolase YqeG